MRRLCQYTLLVFAAMTLTVGAKAGPEDQPLVGIYVDDGLLLVHNIPQAVFTIKIKGGEVQASNIQNGVAFTIDQNKVITLSTMDFSQFAVRPKANNKQRMEEFKASRMAFVKEVGKGARPASATEYIHHKGRIIALWYFDIPIPKTDGMPKAVMTRQIHVTLVVNKTVVLLVAPISKDVNEAIMRKYLITMAKSLRPYAKPIDVKALRARLVKE